MYSLCGITEVHARRVQRLGYDQDALIGEQVDLAALALHIEVVAVLALEALRALALPVVLAHDGLGVHA